MSDKPKQIFELVKASDQPLPMIGDNIRLWILWQGKPNTIKSVGHRYYWFDDDNKDYPFSDADYPHIEWLKPLNTISGTIVLKNILDRRDEVNENDMPVVKLIDNGDHTTTYLRYDAVVKEINTLVKNQKGNTISEEEKERLSIDDYKEVLTDNKRLTRELDVILNGENAAQNPSLCDIVSQLRYIKNNYSFHPVDKEDKQHFKTISVMSTIESNNKIIAEFLGLHYDKNEALMKVYIDGDESVLFHCSWHPDFKEHSNYLAWEFEPNKNWCQLMPVVEKIESMYGDAIIFYIKDKRAYIEIDTQAHLADDTIPDVPECYSGMCDTKIEAVWLAVVEFIKFFNQNK